jgi:signal transduction histidine kinase
MFKSAHIRLTLAYLGIIMAISLFFSAAIYQVSVVSLEDGLRNQLRYLQQPRFGFNGDPSALQQLEERQLDEGRAHILFNLAVTNIVILVLSGGGSYWLARRTLQPIEQVLDAQTRFTADASHELRTPLTSMQTEIEVALRDQGLKLGEAKGLLQSNLEEVGKLRALTEGLLTLSRHQSGKKVEFSRVDLKSTVEEARSRVEHLSSQREADIKVSGKPVVVTGNPEALVNLFSITLENAIKYSQSKPTIEVKVSSKGRMAEVKIRDSGIGISGEDLPHIFNRFYRADTSRSKKTDGYGLGLSIAKQIAKMHKGVIEVQSALGKGTIVNVRLPLRQVTGNILP